MKALVLDYKFRKETNDSITYEPFYKLGDILEITTIKINSEKETGCSYMKISEVEEMIEKAKKEGCNYVEIDYHCDHDSYIFSGLEIREGTDEELQNEMERKEGFEKKEAQRKIKEYEKMIEELQKKL